MTAGLRALLTGIIDYAGLFPPAALPLDQAIRNYARYRQEPESWMLGRFICPSTKLEELTPYLELFNDGPLVLSVLGRGPKEVPEEFLGTLQGDVEAIGAFQERHGRQIAIAAFETKPPTSLSAAQLAILLLDCQAATNRRLPPPIRRIRGGIYSNYLESWYEVTLPNLYVARAGVVPASCGLKFRCGGTEAAAFPSVGQVADFLICGLDVPLKFTAGLHHPIRHFDAELKVKMHGFINLFVAGVLAHSRKLDQDQELVQQIVEDEDPASFGFDDAGLRWRDLRASVEEIAAARNRVTSFGSCSFDEPRDELRALGWL